MFRRKIRVKKDITFEEILELLPEPDRTIVEELFNSLYPIPISRDNG